MNRLRRILTCLAASLLLAVPFAAVTAGTAHAATAYYVSTTGNNTNPGTQSAPFRTITRGLQAVQPGDTLYVRGGTYQEHVNNPSVAAGTTANRITVTNFPGERPVIQGLFWVASIHNWDISGINVTWNTAIGGPSDHMVKVWASNGWTFKNAEVWGARSYAAILVAGASTGWTLSHLHVHDTYATNNTNQDHLIYVSGGVTGGMIERNILVRSPNGRAVKLGPPSAGAGSVSGVTIRYNTMTDNTGPQNVQPNFDVSNTLIHHNILVRPLGTVPAVGEWSLTGSNNVVRDNVAWGTTRGVISSSNPGLVDGGGNFTADPQFVDEAGGDYRTQNPAVADYGRHAPK